MGIERAHKLLGALPLEESDERLEYSMVEGSCRSAEVMGYLDAFAEDAEKTGEEVVVVLDDAPFHNPGMIREREDGRREMGLRHYQLPVYFLHLNLIEGVWRRLKGFLMLRRFYDSVAELKEAVFSALGVLGAVKIHTQLGDT